jgi:MFS family permease
MSTDDTAAETAGTGLLANSSFRRLIESRAVGQVAQNALLYALLILVVEKTGSSIQTTLFVTAFTLPSILFGIPAGALAEALPRRLLIVVGYLVRAAAVGAMLYYREDVWIIYLLLFGFATMGQITGPAESAAIPQMVRPEQVATANSFFVLSVMAGQVGGAIIMAPFLLKVLGDRAVLATASVVFVLAAVVAAGVKGLQRPLTARAFEGNLGIKRALAQGWRVIHSSNKAFMAMVYLTIAATLGRSLAVLAPHYTRDILKIATEDAVFVMAPAAIGALLALLLTPLMVRLIGASRTAALAFVLLALGLIGLGLVVYVRDFMLSHVDLGISFVEERVGVSSVITMAMILAVPVGLAMTMVTVASKAVLNQEAPSGTQARVFATQSALSDALSLLPLFAIGAVAELVGVREVLLVAASTGLVAAAYLGLLHHSAAGQPST